MAASAGAVEVFEGSTRDAHRIQMQTLRSILERNAGVGYLRRFLCGDAGFPDPAQADPAHTAAAFRRLVPLSSYDDYADLIDRVADGAEPPTALSVDPLLCFFNRSLCYFDPFKFSSLTGHRSTFEALRTELISKMVIVSMDIILLFLLGKRIKHSVLTSRIDLMSTDETGE